MSFGCTLARVSCVGLFGDNSPIMEECLFLCLLSKSLNILRMRIPGHLVPAGLFLAEWVVVEETAGVDHFNDAFSIILSCCPLPLQKFPTYHRVRLLPPAHLYALQQAIRGLTQLSHDFGNGHIIYIIEHDMDLRLRLLTGFEESLGGGRASGPVN